MLPPLHSPLSFRMDKLVVSQLLRTRWHGGQVHGHPGLDRVVRSICQSCYVDLSIFSMYCHYMYLSQLLRTRWLGGQVHGHPGLDRVPWTTRLDRHLHLCGHLDPGLAKSCHLSTQHPDHTPVPGDYKNCKISQRRFSHEQTSLDLIHLQISHSCHLFAISSVPRFDAAQIDFRVKNSK